MINSEKGTNARSSSLDVFFEGNEQVCVEEFWRAPPESLRNFLSCSEAVSVDSPDPSIARGFKLNDIQIGTMEAAFESFGKVVKYVLRIKNC